MNHADGAVSVLPTIYEAEEDGYVCIHGGPFPPSLPFPPPPFSPTGAQRCGAVRPSVRLSKHLPEDDPLRWIGYLTRPRVEVEQ